ncbi:MAG: elongation factor G [Planctomycetota bacterium]|nr:MAG: elongation factor G [Planctomycetota bacterium]
MAKYETKDIRNIVLVGHNSSGKTTLGEAMLFKTKATSRMGSVEDGTSVFDFEPEEKERKNTIDLAVASVNVQGREINILDAPGYPDFVGEAVCGMSAVETAVICINAADGIRVNTRKMWDLATKIGVARVISINKMDHDNIKYVELINSIREAFGKDCVPVMLPSGVGEAFKSVVSLITNPDGAPADLKALASEAREKLMEADDKLIEEYLEGKLVTPEELAGVLPKAFAQGRLVPILCTSAKKDVGVSEFMDFIAKYTPSPLDEPPKKGTDPEKKLEIERSPGGPLSGQVFKSIADPVVHRLSYVRVYSGTLSADQPLFNQRTGKAARIGAMFKPFGKDQRSTTAAVAGDIVVVAKVDELNTGDTICDSHAVIQYPKFEFPLSMVSQAVEPKTKQDLARMSESMHKMADTDPTFHFSRDPGTGELVITGRSKLHVEMILARLKRKFHVEVITHPPKLALKEAIVQGAEGHHKHKKQSGGHGQYGEVYLRLKPTPRGEGFKFTDSISQGRIPQQYVPAIEKGIRKTIEKGVVAGYTVVDVEVEVYDGSYHDVDSGPASFELAGSKAFKDAFAKAKPVILEPIVHIEITVPSKFMGDITGDLNSRRGRIEGMDSQGHLQVVRAHIPMMEIMDYETQLRSVTGGEGSYTIEPSHYDVMPHKLAQDVIAKAKKPVEEEE